MKTHANRHISSEVPVQPLALSHAAERSKKRSSAVLRMGMLCAMLIAMAFPVLAQEEIVGGPGATYQNPLQIALNAWYPANLTAILTNTSGYYHFSTPGGVLFDGSNLWVAHASTPNAFVDKLQVSDGKLIGSYRVGGAAGSVSGPAGFDGLNIWLPEHQPSANVVHRIRAADGVSLSDCNLGSNGYYPNTAVFDGQFMWVGTDTNTVVKVNASTCAVACSNTSVASRIYGMAYDGVNMWATAVDRNAVVKLNSSCAQVGIVTVPGPIGIAFDGTNMWTANQSGASTSRINVSSGAVTSYSLGVGPAWAIAYDGANMWVTGYTTGKVSKISTTTPTNNPPSFQTCASASSEPVGIAFDGAHVWLGCEGVNALGKM
jgi:hypothetical protein